MYHSISQGPAPLCLAPDLFRRHLDVLEQRGLEAVSLADHLARPGPDQVVLTFDDGYQDFFETVAPELEQRGWSATTFLAVETIDSNRLPFADWARLMSWQQVSQLGSFEIGSHALTHRDLTTLPEDEARREVSLSGQRLTERLGRQVVTFAAPFGRTNAVVEQAVREHYRGAVTTVLGLATPESDRFALPRLEMYYYQDAKRLADLLDGNGQAYLRLRQILRKARQWIG